LLRDEKNVRGSFYECSAFFSPKNSEDNWLGKPHIDLSKDGTYLIGQDGRDVSYFAEVKNQKVTEFFCTDTSGTRIPSFVLTGQVRSLQVCYCCYYDYNGD
jgi:hypothetical protein